MEINYEKQGIFIIMRMCINISTIIHKHRNIMLNISMRMVKYIRRCITTCINMCAIMFVPYSNSSTFNKYDHVQQILLEKSLRKIHKHH